MTSEEDTFRRLIETRISDVHPGDLWFIDGAWVPVTSSTVGHPDDRVPITYTQDGEDCFDNPRGFEVAIVKRVVDPDPDEDLAVNVMEDNIGDANDGWSIEVGDTRLLARTLWDHGWRPALPAAPPVLYPYLVDAAARCMYEQDEKEIDGSVPWEARDPQVRGRYMVAATGIVTAVQDRMNGQP